jgi:copper chaperone CopZ
MSSTHNVPMGEHVSCPQCGTRTRAVPPITIRSLLNDDSLATLSSHEGFRFCRNSECDTTYHHPVNGRILVRADVRLRIGQKETGPDRPICYCFDYAVADLAAEVAATGASTIPDIITGNCRKGLDRCEEENPQGACCLGNVRKAYQAILADHNDSTAVAWEPTADSPDCCPAQMNKNDTPPTTAPPSGSGRTRWLAGGALFAAATSSACCWLPLLLIGFGASAAGVGSFFETYRPIMLGATGLFLGVGFYLIYFRKPRCEPGSACRVPNPKLRRLEQIMLWVATVAVAALAFFPSYSGLLLGGGDGLVATASASTIRSYRIDGMTCGGCAAHLQQAIGAVEGIDRVSVSYDSGTADVLVPSDADFEALDQAVGEAIETAGYELVSVTTSIRETPFTGSLLRDAPSAR